MELVIYDLPKISLNKWYSGKHWSNRVHIKKLYKYAILEQFKSQFSKHDTYDVEYHFEFKSRPLDASNCVAMVKLIEDCIFEDDNWEIVNSIKITSSKGKRDLVIINVK